MSSLSQLQVGPWNWGEMSSVWCREWLCLGVCDVGAAVSSQGGVITGLLCFGCDGPAAQAPVRLILPLPSWVRLLVLSKLKFKFESRREKQQEVCFSDRSLMMYSDLSRQCFPPLLVRARGVQCCRGTVVCSQDATVVAGNCC